MILTTRHLFFVITFIIFCITSNGMVSDQSYYLGILSIVIIMVLCCIVYHPDTVQDTMVTDGMGAFETDISDPTTVKTITVAKMHECIAAIKFTSGGGSRTVYYIMDTSGCVYRIHFETDNFRNEYAYYYDRVIWMNLEINGTYTVKLNEIGEVIDILPA